LHRGQYDVHDNSNFGIDLDVGGGGTDVIQRCIVEHNHCYGNDSYGIAIEQDTGGATHTINNITRFNRIHGNAVALICNGSEQDHIYYNLFYDGGSVDVLGATDIEMYNNVFYATEITHWTGSDGLTLKNNIFYENQSGLDYFIEQNAAATNLVADYNAYYKGTGSGWFRLNNVGINNFATWQSNGQDAHGTYSVDPLFVNVGTRDFHLQSGSPCKDTGVSLSLTEDFDGNAVGASPDKGAFEFTLASASIASRGLRVYWAAR